MWRFGPRLLPTKAVADKEGEEPFAAPGDHSQGKLGGEGPVVRTVTLDRLCETCEPPALIKVDVEGADTVCSWEQRSALPCTVRSFYVYA